MEEARDRIYGRRGGGSKGYLVPEQQQSSIVSTCPDFVWAMNPSPRASVTPRGGVWGVSRSPVDRRLRSMRSQFL